MLGLQAVNAQRETFRDEDSVRVHFILTKGGSAVNVVPADVRIEAFVRAKSMEALLDADKKVDRALKSGAMAIGCNIEITNIPGYMPLKIDETMAKLFADNAAILQSAGRDLYDAMVSTVGRGVFRQMERDAAIMRRNTGIFKIGQLEGMEELGRTTPNDRERSLILGYTSQQRSGGNTALFLERKTDELLKDVEARWVRYVERVSMAGEFAVIVFFIFPFLVMTSVFVSPSLGVGVAQLFLVVCVPLLVTVSIVIIRTTQPKNFNQLAGNPWQAIVFAAVSFSICVWLSLPSWFSVVASLAAASLGFGVPVFIQMREISEHESSLPQFLRDVTEYQKMGYDLIKATITLAKESNYTPKFNRTLGYAAKRLSLGSRFSEIDLPTRSWMTKMAFFQLGELAETGAYQTKSLEYLTNFVANCIRLRRDARSSMTVYKILAMATPVALALMMGLMTGFLKSFSKIGTGAGSVALPIFSFTVSPLLVALSQASIIASAVGVSLVSSYAADFTAKNTVWIALNIILAGVGILLSGSVVSITGGLF